MKLERYLATCDLALFPQLLEDAYRSGTPFQLGAPISRAWAERDIEGYATWALTQPPRIEFGATGNTSMGTRLPIVWSLTEDDPLAAMEMADRLYVDEHDKWMILQKAMKEEPATALLLAKAHPEIYLQQQWGMNGSSHSGIGPMQALPVLQALHPGGGRAYFANDGFNFYAAHPDKFDEAEIWFRKLPADAQRSVVAKLDRDRFFNPDFADNIPRLREIWKLPEG